jgi:cell division protein FtsB
LAGHDFGLPKFKLCFASLADCWYNNIVIIKYYMVNKGKKSNFERIFFNQKFLTLIGLIAVILISLPFAKNAVKRHKINKEISNFKEEIADLQNKSADLKNFVSYLESDQFAEEQARLNLNLKKPGEELTVVKPGAGGLNLASSSEGDSIFNIPGRKKEEPRPESSNPRKWLNYFFR